MASKGKRAARKRINAMCRERNKILRDTGLSKYNPWIYQSAMPAVDKVARDRANPK